MTAQHGRSGVREDDEARAGPLAVAAGCRHSVTLWGLVIVVVVVIVLYKVLQTGEAALHETRGGRPGPVCVEQVDLGDGEEEWG